MLALISILIRSDSSHSAMTSKLILLGTCINKEIWVWQRIFERSSAKKYKYCFWAYGMPCYVNGIFAGSYLMVGRDTVKSTRQDFSDPQKDSFVSYV